jgi:hypothetical protein
MQAYAIYQLVLVPKIIMVTDFHTQGIKDHSSDKKNKILEGGLGLCPMTLPQLY